MRIAILCSGSQGDVRPFVALGSALKVKGHDVFIAANLPNEEFCKQNGLSFVPLPGDFLECIKAGKEQSNVGTLQIVKRIFQILGSSFRQQFEVLYDQLQKIDLVLYHPVIFTAEHIAEALKIPSVRIHLQPDIPTSHFACSLFPPRMPKWTRRLSHPLAALAFYLPFRKIINEWRVKRLGLKKMGFSSPLSHPPFQAIPKFIAVSQHLVPPPPDWPKNVHITGFLELPKVKTWTPPPALQQFLTEEPPLYIGFGSFTEQCTQKMIDALLAVLQKLSLRTLLCGPFPFIKKELLPQNILWIESAPHDWLFPKVKAIVHHGGAGTTHASALAGKPLLLVPFLFDQFHWGDKIHRLGLGPKPLPSKKFTEQAFQNSLEQLLNTPSYSSEALLLSEKMKQENGVETALNLLPLTAQRENP